MSKIIEIIDSDDENHIPTSTTNTLPINNIEPESNQQSQSRRRRRKSALHVMNDPDMQFQTINLEDDDDDVDNNCSQQTFLQINPVNNNSGIVSTSHSLLKTPKTVPNILAPKTLTNEFEANFEQFINDPETINDIYSLAEERTRINYLLALNCMPEINFTLYTRPEHLQFQFEEMLKRRMVNNRDNTRTPADNHHSLFQNNEQNTS